jgi:hypothetical protein
MFAGHYTGIGAGERPQLLRRWKQVFSGQWPARQWMLKKRTADFTDNTDIFQVDISLKLTGKSHSKALRR